MLHHIRHASGMLVRSLVAALQGVIEVAEDVRHVLEMPEVAQHVLEVPDVPVVGLLLGANP